MMLVVSVNPVAAVVVRPPTVVVGPVVRITPVITVRIIARIAIVAVTIGRITESNSNSPNSDGNLSVSLFYRNQSQSDCYQWK